jgi:hypothetical protein
MQKSAKELTPGGKIITYIGRKLKRINYLPPGHPELVQRLEEACDDTTERSGLPSAHQVLPDILLLSIEQTGFVECTATEGVSLYA